MSFIEELRCRIAEVGQDLIDRAEEFIPADLHAVRGYKVNVECELCADGQFIPEITYTVTVLCENTLKRFAAERQRERADEANE